MADMDQGIKRLLQARPADVLSLALPGVEYLEPMPTQVATEPQLELDTLFRVRYQGAECAVNIEAQGYPDPDMPRRCFDYGSRASIVHRGLPVLSVVLWLQRQRTTPGSLYEMKIGSWIQATWKIINIEVSQLAAEDIVASGALGLLPLVPFMRGADLPLIERAAVVVRDSARGELAGDLISLLAVFMARFHGEDAARTMVRSVFVSTELLNESPLYRSWRAEAEAEGRAKGEAEGRAKGEAEGRVEGRVEGKAEGLREATRAALSGRFGAPDGALLALVAAADEAALLAVLAHIATDTLDQTRERLRPAQ